MARHSGGDIDGALVAARQALALAPGFGEAHAYVGNTLVTRKRRFADGLAALERAAELRPDDPAVLYTLGWCREFAADALEHPKGAHQPVREDAPTLYARAREVLLRALALGRRAGAARRHRGYPGRDCVGDGRAVGRMRHARARAAAGR